MFQEWEQQRIEEVPPRSNRGELIDSVNRFARVPLRSPWCASINSYATRYSQPHIVSGWALHHAPKGGRVTTHDVLLGLYQLKPGDVAVKTRRGGGHVDTIEEVLGDEIIVIGGNVADAVTRRKMPITAYKYFVPTEG